MDELLDRLREKHNDTWPIQIGHGEPVNRDGNDAACEIERLRQQNNTLRTLFRVNMIRAAGVSHAEIDAALAEALGETV